MTLGPEIEWVVQLCRLHRPPLAPVFWFPPSGNPNSHDLDAILETEDRLECITVEVTRCYRGDRASGEAKIEERFLDLISAWFRDTATACLGATGYRVTSTVYLPGPLSALVPHIKEFLRSPQELQVTRTAVEHALRDAERRRHAVMIGDTDTSVLPQPVLFHPASQVYVEHTVPADAAEFNCMFRELAQGRWRPAIPMSFWTDTQAIIDAITDKRAKLSRYRESATAARARALWLLLIVEQAMGWDIHAALRGNNSNRLCAALAEQPQFDEIYLLAQMPGYPWYLRKIHPSPGTIGYPKVSSSDSAHPG